MAFDFIPKNDDELDCISNAEIRADLKLVFQVMTVISGVKDPIALDKNKPKTVKVSRSVKDSLKQIEQKLKIRFDSKGKTKYGLLSLSMGDGSRGGRGAGNLGNKFEKELYTDLITLKDEGLPGKFRYPRFIVDFAEEMKLAKADFDVIAEGSKNQKRPLHFDTSGFYFGTKNNDIGKIVTDITLKIDGKPCYLSLKFGSKVSFFNVGVTKFFSQADVKKRTLNKQGLHILETFGIDPIKFCNIFNLYGKGAHKKMAVKPKSYDKNNITKMLESGIGYGYYIVHSDKVGKIHYTYMDKGELRKYTVPKSITIMYPDKNAKRIDVIVETERMTYQIVIRNSAGGIYPNIIAGDYTIK